MQKLTYEQQLIEELNSLSEMMNVLTPQQIHDVPKIREVFRYLRNRKERCEKAIKAFKWKPGQDG